MASGFEENDSCFINWEKLTKKGNNALKDSERTNFLEHIQHAPKWRFAFCNCCRWESSEQYNKGGWNYTVFSYEQNHPLFRHSERYSNSGNYRNFWRRSYCSWPYQENACYHQDFPQIIETENQTEFLLGKALAKQRELRSEFLKIDVDLNPLIVIQLPNKSETLQDSVERYLETKGLTYENGQLADLAFWQAREFRGNDTPCKIIGSHHKAGLVLRDGIVPEHIFL